MRPKEDYTPFIAAGFILTLAILVSFQVYILREPGRIASVEASDKAIAVEAGQSLFKKNCTLCHGDNGEGDSAPALNDKTFLNTTADDTIFSVISSGIPGMIMAPASPHACVLLSWSALSADLKRLVQAIIEQMVNFSGIDNPLEKGQALTLNREIAWRLRRHPLFYDAE